MCFVNADVCNFNSQKNHLEEWNGIIQGQHVTESVALFDQEVVVGGACKVFFIMHNSLCSILFSSNQL